MALTASIERPQALVLLGGFTTLVVQAGLVLSIASVSLIGWSIGPSRVLFGILLVLALIGEALPIPWISRDGPNYVTATWAVIAGLVFITTGYISVALTLAVSVAGDLAARQRPSRIAFNGAMLALSVGASIGVLDLLGQRTTLTAGDPVTWSWALAAALALATMFLVNAVLLSGVIALNEGLDVRTVFIRDGLANLSTDGVLLPLGPIVVMLGLFAPFLLVPLLLVAFTILRSSRMAGERLHEATHDSLTSLVNRRLFFQTLDSAMAHRGSRTSGALGVMIIDLDEFKQVNDTLGHDVGDAVLIELAGRLRRAVPEDVLVARLGGDEFAVFCAHAPSGDEVLGLAQSLLPVVRKPLTSNGFPLTISASVGVAVAEEGDVDLSASKLMRRADVAMYSAKASGSGVMLFGTDINDDSAPGRLALVSQLGEAIDAGQLRVHYQPITDVRTGRTQRVEALVRWSHPLLGEIRPLDFLPLAEQTDLIRPLTDLVIGQALGDCARWMAAGHAVGVAINLSSRLINNPQFPEILRQAAASAGVHPSVITLEITEDSVVGDSDRVTSVLRQIRGMGVRVAIDDFGTGLSSLAGLRDLPVDELKIDQRFSGAVLNGEDDELIIRTIVSLAAGLGLSTVAEGAETEAIATRLLDLGCSTMQGFHLARPMPAHEVQVWLDQRPPTVQASGAVTR